MPQNYGALERVLRMGEGRRIKRLAEQAAYVATLEPDFERLSDAELAGKTAEFRQRLEIRVLCNARGEVGALAERGAEVLERRLELAELRLRAREVVEQ